MGILPPPPPRVPWHPTIPPPGLPVRYASREDARDMETGDAVPCTADDYLAVLRERGLVEGSKMEFGIQWPDPPPGGSGESARPVIPQAAPSRR